MNRVSAAIFALIVCPLTTHAQARVPAIAESRFASFDIGALKAGDWVEYGFDNYGEKLSYRFACVAIEGDTVLIEYSDRALTMWFKDTVILAAVNKGDRKVTKAWWGKPGEKGQEIKVKAAGGEGEDSKVKGKVSKDKVTVAGKEFDAEKLEMEITKKVDGEDHVLKLTTWVVEGLPFKGSFDTRADPTKVTGDIRWDGDPPHEGTLVKAVDSFATIVLTGFGKDAKQTLQK